MLKSSLVLLKLSSIDVGFASNYYLEYCHFFKMTQLMISNKWKLILKVFIAFSEQSLLLFTSDF